MSRLSGNCGIVGFGVSLLLASGCQEPQGLMRAMPAEITVKFDFDHRPLPEIPLPNDIATRPDISSATGKRINASIVAPTKLEVRVRTLIDQLNGWGVYQPISIPFTGPIDVNSVTARHWYDNDLENDVIYLINIDRDSDEFGRVHHLDLGNGNYPVILEKHTAYGDNDPRGYTISLPFEETDEDLDRDGELDPGEDENHNGVLDPGEDKNGNGLLDLPEDTDADGVLDRPNYMPNRLPGRDDLAGRADALMTFYERETNTLLAAPLVPLQEETTYAVVVTRRILDGKGNPVGSPFAWVNHTAQTDDLAPLEEVLPTGLEIEDVAFAFSYTTESVTRDWIAVREGLYELGPQAHIGEDFPPDIAQLELLKDASHPGFENRNPYIAHHEDIKPVISLAVPQLLGLDLNSQQAKSLLGAHDYVDYHAMGTFVSPQLFDRYDDDGNRLNLDLQSWPPDLDRVPAKARAEEVPFWTVMPRKEISARGQGEMVPLVILGHGYTGNRVGELIGFAGFLAEFGMAVLSTDNVSHGLALSEMDTETLTELFKSAGLGPAADAVKFTRGGMVDDDGDGVFDRHFQDLDRDGLIDSGVDFWTSYLFHTRDMMRQSALDYMQLIRIIRTWDGVKTWPYDTNNDGILSNDLAGDFDGDGAVDIGRDSPIYVMGGSLGGIMSTALGAVEPEVDAIIPIAGGGRLSDVGNRSRQGGVPQAVIMRVMGPNYLVTVSDDGSALVHTQVTELNNTADIPIRRLDASVAVMPGDTFVAENMANDEVACAYLLPDTDANGVAARARVSLASDLGDETVLKIYRGPVLQTGSTECELIEEPGDPIAMIDSMDAPLTEEGTVMTFEGLPIESGKLASFAEGYGLRRANPELRRFMGLAQLVLDPTDPGVLARHLAAQPFRYPNKGDVTGARFLIVTTVGDMNVPASSGVTVARAAGVVDFLTPDPRYPDMVSPTHRPPTPNQILIDTHTAEAVNILQRHPYKNVPDNENIRGLLGLDDTFGAHFDVDNFSGGQDIWGMPPYASNSGDNLERLDPGLRLVMRTDMWGNDLGGFSGAVFPYAVPEGQHGFALPGEMTDWAIQICKETHGSTDPQCDDEAIAGQVYDVGWAMFHLFGQFATRGATEYPIDEGCWSKESCSNLPPVPEPRELSTLP